METPNQTNLQDNKRLPLDWDVLGLTSAAIALVGTAIFFISGWIYEAHWFSFFGVNIAQLSLDPIRNDGSRHPWCSLFHFSIPCINSSCSLSKKNGKRCKFSNE